MTAGPKDSPSQVPHRREMPQLHAKPCSSVFCSQLHCIKRDYRTKPSGTEHISHTQASPEPEGKLLKDRRQTVIHSNQVLPPAVNTDKLEMSPLPTAPGPKSMQTQRCSVPVLSDSRQTPRESRASHPALRPYQILPQRLFPGPEPPPQWFLSGNVSLLKTSHTFSFQAVSLKQENRRGW